MKFFDTTWVKVTILSLGLVAINNQLRAQSDLISPYSLYGPGIINWRQSIAQAGLGGAGLAVSNPYRLNLVNPAANTSILDPIFEVGGRGSFSTFETGTQSFENQNFELNNLNLSFPIKRNEWVLNMGLYPLSSVGYDVTTLEENSELGPYRTMYSGDGGISQAMLGMSYKVFSKTDTAANISSLSFGAQLNYNFGTIRNTRTVIYPEQPFGLGFQSSETVLLRDVNVELGFHGETNIKKRTLSNPSFIKLQLGGVYAIGTPLKAEQNNYVFNFYNTTGPSRPQDTLSSATQLEGRVELPSRLTVGTALDYVSRKRMRLRLSLDYSLQTWNDYEVSFPEDGLNANLNNSQRMAAGLEFTPELGSSNYFETVEIRTGFYYEQTNLNLRNTDISDIGMSFGFSLPVHHRRALTKSAFHVSAQYGNYGTTDNGLIQESYIRVFAGFSFTPHFRNRWFVKPQYD